MFARGPRTSVRPTLTHKFDVEEDDDEEPDFFAKLNSPANRQSVRGVPEINEFDDKAKMMI